MKSIFTAKNLFAVLLCIACLFSCFTFVSIALLFRDKSDTASVLAANNVTVIIDAGHGGEDCGTIGVNGVFEKDINLSVAKELEHLLTQEGINVIMTRTEDKLLYTEAQNIKGQKKQFDLKNRLEHAKSNPDAIFVSIHMNNFHMESCRGIQVYYSGQSEESSRLAQSIQSSVTDNLQTYNTRKIKSSGGEIYLLDNAVGVAVLVECGFLSNREECEKLSEKDYQRQLSFRIFCGIMEYINN